MPAKVLASDQLTALDQTSTDLCDIADSPDFDNTLARGAVIGMFLHTKVASLQAMMDRRLSSGDKAVYGAILSYLNPQTKTSWPSYELIARTTGFSEKAVRNSIAYLKRVGYLISKRAAIENKGHWLTQYAIGDLVSPAVIEAQIANAIEGLKGRSFPAFSVVPTAPASGQLSKPTAPSSGQLARPSAPASGQLAQVGQKANCPLEGAVGSKNGGQLPTGGGSWGPTAQFSGYSITTSLSKEKGRKVESGAQVCANETDLFGGGFSSGDGWLKITSRSIVAVLTSNTGKPITRTVTASTVKHLASVLRITPIAAQDLIADQFTVWHGGSFVGSHANWERTLLDECIKRHATIASVGRTAEMGTGAPKELLGKVAGVSWED
jgi:biotin operon repressor